jgi:hypothetical protein
MQNNSSRPERGRRAPPLQSAYEQVFEIVLDLKRFSFWRTRKSRGIEDDGIEFFASPGEPRQDGSHVVRDKAMIDR